MKRRLQTLLNSAKRRSRMAPVVDQQIVLTPVEARQGVLGKPVLLVLVVSLILIIGSLTLYVALGQ